MPLGYCTHCEQRKPIVKLALKLGSRECEWGPVEHDLPPTHARCGGVVLSVEITNDVYEMNCQVCGERDVPDQDLLPAGRCFGSRRPIR